MDASQPFSVLRRGRWSVAGVFFANGFLVGSWVPQIPLLLGRFHLTSFTLGLLLLLFGAGAISSMMWCGHLLGRFGSKRVAGAFASYAVFGLLFIVLSPVLPLAALALFAFGATVGGMDVAMNANAVEVERRLGRAVTSSCHGFWSLGGFAGGGLGGLVVEHWGSVGHAIAVTIIAALIATVAVRGMISEHSLAVKSKLRLSLPRKPAIYLVGIMALFSMVPEGAILDWAALYLKQERGASIAAASFAFAAFSGTMALTRFAGDWLRNLYGAVMTLRISSLLAALAMLGAGLLRDPMLAIAAFALAGFGIANMVPIAFSTAGNQEGLSAGAGISTVTLMGYAGLLFAPSIIGLAGGHFGFAAVFTALPLLLLIVFLFAGLARAADRPPFQSEA
ncbi:MAG TPA: MFS transporter [Rhizobiaceae bacterium]|nr:MFS transporter [Rhizobiaceae bacterium]